MRRLVAIALAAAGGILVALAAWGAYLDLSCEAAYQKLGGQGIEAAAREVPVTAWLQVEGTEIDYPVAEPGADMAEGFYLTHDIWGQPSRLGCPYVDGRTTASSLHVMVYGHRIGWTGLMFGPLWDAYRAQAFSRLGDAHLVTPDGGEVAFEPLCALSVPAAYGPVQRFDFQDQDELAAFALDMAERATARSDGWRGLAADARRVLTLVTCTEANGHSSTRTLVLFVSDTAAGT